MSPSRIALVVDDDDNVRKFMALPLSRSNFRVMEAANGVDALKVATAFCGQIDILVTDIEMPEMGGRELALAFRERFPAAPVLFVSGFSPRQIASLTRSDFLAKPFGPAEFMARVNRLMSPVRVRSVPRSARVALPA